MYINFTNIKKYTDVPFREYLKVNGFSHSFLKREVNGTSPEFISSEKVELGNLVDAILTQPDKLDIYSPQLKRAEKIADCINVNFGSYIQHFESQVSMSADMDYLGFKMPFKVRLDWGLKNIAVIELKVTAETNFKAVIEHMGYDNQLFGQCGAYGVKLPYILIYSSKNDKYDLIERPLNTGEFWKEKILKFGTYGK
jgi:hypothetical protein